MFAYLPKFYVIAGRRGILLGKQFPLHQPCKRKFFFRIAWTTVNQLQNDVGAVSPRTNLPDYLSSDIEDCQPAGKMATISLGGATGTSGFSGDAEAAAYAQTIWDLVPRVHSVLLFWMGNDASP